MGEVPKIEWAPREDARDEVQKRFNEFNTFNRFKRLGISILVDEYGR